MLYMHEQVISRYANHESIYSTHISFFIFLMYWAVVFYDTFLVSWQARLFERIILTHEKPLNESRRTVRELTPLC